MASTTGRRAMTDDDRAAYREQRRQQAEQLVDELLTTDGWQTWLRLRRLVREYSWTNQLLIALGAHRQGFAPTIVKPAGGRTGGPGTWRGDGFHPAKGTSALYIWAPYDRRRRNGTWTCCEKTTNKRVCPSCKRDALSFRLKPVFDASQVRSFETGEPPTIDLPPAEPIIGDELEFAIAPLIDHAIGAGWIATADLDATPERGEGGSWDPVKRHLRVCAVDEHGTSVPANKRLRVAIHELAHALGISRFNAELSLAIDEAEVAVECVSYIVAGAAGLDTASEAVPYVVGWGAEDAAAKVRRFAALIDQTAKTIEEPLLDIVAARQAAAEAAA